MKMEVLARFRAGEEMTFQRIVEEYSPRLLGIIRPFAQDLDEAHDLLQETWLRAYDKRRTFRGSGSLLGWLCTISRNLCRARLRRKKVPERHLSPQDQPEAAPEDAPKGALQANQRRRSIAEVLMELPRRQRDVVLLRILEGHSTAETARELGCAVGTVKATLHQALRKLEPFLEEWNP